MAEKVATTTGVEAPAVKKDALEMNAVQEWVSTLPGWGQQVFVCALIGVPLIALAIILKIMGV